MVQYRTKTPRWLTRLFPSGLLWKMPPSVHPTIYLTFDDGPHPTATPFVLEQLSLYHANATFFCIGKNVVTHPAIYNNILAGNHTPGNHTQNHLNGWKASNVDYFQNIAAAAKQINSKIFRPPYGRMRFSQARKLLATGWQVCMWDVLSGDFDTTITPERCLENVLNNLEPGSIVVFHDSEKAWPRMSYALPLVLEYCKQKNWHVKALPKY
ncbi:MAG: polysaccharide deacetylase family protein [Taibaiella sp.]|nr:polysaccharide deacetylase family protein [Taibaiella sp.]